MDFKIEEKTICIDLRDLPEEEVTLIVNTVMAACDYLEAAGQFVYVKEIEADVA